MSESVRPSLGSHDSGRSAAQRLSAPPAQPEQAAPGGTGFAGALAKLALALHRGGEDPSDSLALITEGAARIIPGAECAAVVTPAGPGKLAGRADYGPLPPAVLALENEVGQGPCLDAASQIDQVLACDLGQDARWPLFSRRARSLGVASMICTPLAVGKLSFGSLSLISTAVDAFDEESASLAAIFATHAAIALAGTDQRRNLATALTSRDVIGQAKGILMERYRITPDAAFALLVSASQSAHTKLRDVADELCRTGAFEGGPEAEVAVSGA